jgi:glycosyltransferase involved in cell wall biosynthesis
MMNNVLHSPILNKFDHYYIPPGVDTEIFKPGTHKLTKPTLVFVSGSLKDKRKGALVIPSILEKLDQALESRGLHVDIKWIGERDIELPSYRNVHNIYLGSLAQDDISIQYASSYIHILPTLADNLPNTILESMACGTPVVAFDIGGCKDVVISHKTGYLAKPGDVDDFVAGIMSLLDNQSQYQEISNNCRLFIKENFNLKIQTIRYVDLIKKICMVDSGQKG